MTKLSIAAYFLRLSSKRYQTIVVYSTLTVVMIFSTMYFFFLLFQCAPISFLWSKYQDGTGHCLKSPILANVTYAQCAMSAITDWSFGILPIFFVWKMQMNPRTKLSVILVLSLGFLSVFPCPPIECSLLSVVQAPQQLFASFISSNLQTLRTTPGMASIL